ncbi:MAG: hypothetical protein KME46_34115 [Brasilonema angustatum HA4187-MV1]|nr:hypothetical protein [Brasilonema angustatum HA4187-MV1]
MNNDNDTSKTAIATLLIAFGLSIGLAATAKFFIQTRPQIHFQIQLDIK